MQRQGLIQFSKWGSLAVGLLLTVGLWSSGAGGLSQLAARGILGFVAWSCLPYLIFAVVLTVAHIAAARQSVQLFLAWVTVVVALLGPLLYLDSMFVHPDAQGALVFLVVPVYQLAVALVAVIVAVVWEGKGGNRDGKSLGTGG